MRDTNLFYRNTTASLTATETSSWLETDGSGPLGLAVFVEIPKQGVGHTLQATVQFSTNGSTLETGTDMDMFLLSSTTAAITTPVQKRRRIAGVRFKYSRVILTALGTSPDFGAVKAGVDHYQAEPNFLGVGAFDPTNPQH